MKKISINLATNESKFQKDLMSFLSKYKTPNGFLDMRASFDGETKKLKGYAIILEDSENKNELIDSFDISLLKDNHLNLLEKVGYIFKSKDNLNNVKQKYDLTSNEDALKLDEIWQDTMLDFGITATVDDIKIVYLANRYFRTKILTSKGHLDLSRVDKNIRSMLEN